MSVAMTVSVAVRHLIAARIARMCAEKRDRARQQSAQQRQEDQCLNHLQVSPSSD
jgi:hypothetical protein